MRKILTLAAVILLASAFQNHVGSNVSPIRIKEIDNLKTGSSANYAYDDRGRILTIHSSLGASIQYQYVGNRVIKITGGFNNMDSQIDTFELNNNGLAELRTGRAGGGLSGITKTKYDGSGFLIESKQYFKGAYSGKYSYDIEHDNQVKYTYANDKNVSSTILYFYYPDKLNTIGDNNLGITYGGKQSKGLVKETVALSEKGDTTAIMFCHYKFDNQGRVIQKVVRQKNGALQDSTGYIYY